MPDGTVRDGYHPVLEAWLGGLEIGVYVALAAIVCLIVVSTVRRIVGAV